MPDLHLLPLKPFWRSLTLACVSIICVLQLSTLNALHAQQPWNYGSVDELSAADAYIVEPPADVRAAVDKAAGTTMPYNCRYHISGPHREFLGQPYYLFAQLQPVGSPSAEQACRIPADIAAQLIPHMVDTRYWESRFAKLLSWTYVDMDRLGSLLAVDTADRRYGRYSPLRWLGYQYQPSEQWPVVFTVATNSRQPQRLTLRALERLAEWGAFATEADQLAYERHMAALDDSLQALDSHLTTLDSQFSTFNFQLSSTPSPSSSSPTPSPSSRNCSAPPSNRPRSVCGATRFSS